jgi:hypothetical protein
MKKLLVFIAAFLLSVCAVNANNGVGPKGPKGDKGNTGATGPQGPIGPQGIQGIQGIKGNIGVTGAQGVKGDTGAAGLNGTNGAQGAQGIQGVKGNTGAKGNTGTSGASGTNGAAGTNGTNGANGIAGSQGVQGNAGFTGTDGAAGVAGLNGKDVDPAVVNGINSRLDSQANAINKLQQTKLLLEQDVRLYDGKSTTIAAFNSYDLNAGHAFAQGLRITVKAGTSYEERLLAKQRDTLKEIQYANFELAKQIAQTKAMLNHINNMTYSTMVIRERVDAEGRVLSHEIITGGLR